jgi:hypothetical protein
MQNPLSDPLLGFHSPSEFSRPSSRRQCRGHPPAPAAPPLRSLPLQRFPVQGSDLVLTPASMRVSTSRFSQPHGALFRPVPAGHLSDQIRSWGCPLQSFSPLAKPYAISGAVALWPFHPLPRSRIRAKRSPSKLTPLGQHYDPDLTETGQPCSDSKALLRARVRHHRRWVRSTKVRSSPGVSPLQGVPPRRNGAAFTAPPLMGLSSPSQATDTTPFKVSINDEVGLSLARLPTLLGFVTF